MTTIDEGKRLARIERRKTLPVGTRGRVCGHRFTLIEKGKRLGHCGWEARVKLDNGNLDTAAFGDEHVTSIPARGER